MKVDYIELEQCNECPYRDTEVIKKTVLRCKKYISCKRVINLLSGNPPHFNF